VTSDFLRAPLRALPDHSGCVIDCDTCTVRGAACADCVVSVMLGGPPDAVRTPAGDPGPGPDAGLISLDPDAQRALAVLADAGVVPPLRMTRPAGPGPVPPFTGPT
jgi:hypothetical protein